MSLMKTMNIGMSGMGANGAAMSIIGDNIANVNTVGFKASRARFQDLMANTMLGIGDGSKMAGAQQQFGQGSLEMTGNALDLSVAGGGFLMVKGMQGGQEQTYLTRAGGFALDADGFVTSPEGMRLQGYSADADGNISGTLLGDLEVGNATSPPSASTSATMRVNLDAGTEATHTFDPADAANTSDHSSDVTLYDSLGNEIPAVAYYVKTGAGTWETHVMVDGGDTEGGTPGTPVEVGSGTLTFDESGNLTSTDAIDLSFTPAGLSGAQTVSLSLTGSTQVAGPSTNDFASSNGYAAGELSGIDIADDGTIMGIFSNGEQQALGQVAIASVGSPEGLERIGGNMWRSTQQSGDVVAGAPGTSGRGALVSGALEGSNVDLAYEFTKMIAVQRGFQASSRTITTGNEMISEAISLKR